MLNRFLPGVGLALAMATAAVTQGGASQSGDSGARQAVSNAPRFDTVGTHSGRLALTDSGLLFRPCRLAAPYLLEYAGGTRAYIFEQIRWRMRRPNDELFVVFRGMLVRRGGKKATKSKRAAVASAGAKGADNSRSRVEFVVNRVDSIRVLRFNECAAPRSRG